MDNISEVHRSWNMSRIKGKNTKPELLVRSLLHRMGYRFRIHCKDLPGKPDVVFPKYKTVIFVHGCFWHRHDGCKYAYSPKSRMDFWGKKFNATIERDKKKTAILRASGWYVIVVWECELKDNAKNVINKIDAILKGEQDVT